MTTVQRGSCSDGGVGPQGDHLPILARGGDEEFMEGGLSKPRPEGQMGVKQRVRGRVNREGDSRLRE